MLGLSVGLFSPLFPVGETFAPPFFFFIFPLYRFPPSQPVIVGPFCSISPKLLQSKFSMGLFSLPRFFYKENVFVSLSLLLLVSWSSILLFPDPDKGLSIEGGPTELPFPNFFLEGSLTNVHFTRVLFASHPPFHQPQSTNSKKHPNTPLFVPSYCKEPILSRF